MTSAADWRLAITMRPRWITALAATILFSTSSSAEAREPTKLSPGFTQERSLAPSENHVYTLSLDQGAAVLGEADQHSEFLNSHSRYHK